MTASQRPERVDRAALIEAVEAHVIEEWSEVFADHLRRNRYGLFCSCGWRTELSTRDVATMERQGFAHRLDAILPLIADAIDTSANAECSERNDPVTARAYQRRALSVPLHYPDGRPGFPCEGCDGARAADEATRNAASLVRSYLDGAQ